LILCKKKKNLSCRIIVSLYPSNSSFQAWSRDYTPQLYVHAKHGQTVIRTV